MQGVPGPALISSTTLQNNAQVPAPISSPAPASGPAKPNYLAFSAFESSHPIPQVPSQPFMFQQQQAPPEPPQKQATPQPTQQAPSDPFAALASPLLHGAHHNPALSTSSSMFDFSQPASTAPAQPTAPAADDDDWAFSSALPESQGLTTSNYITVSDTSVNVVLHASRRSPSDPVIVLNVSFSSKVVQPITELTFQMAVTKVIKASRFDLRVQRDLLITPRNTR